MWMCGRSLLLVASVLLVAGGLPAPADAQRFSLFRNAINNIKSASPVLSNVIETVQNRTATVVKNIVKYAVSRSTDDEVCYFILGCFRLDEPWISLQRPLPKPKDPSAINVNYYLHTREAPQRYHINDSPELTMTGSSYDPTKKTFFITHGFLNSGDSQWMTDLKSALLSQVDGNVFIVDWGGGAIEPNYLQAASNTRVVGRELALLSRTLIERYGANPRDFHFLGHSLGAHISGYAARNVTNVGRVTAFDPAGPGFEKLPRLVRLNKYSASFVDVLHTNAKPVTALGFGMMHPIGDVDFYMNGGVEQPGCAKPNIAPLKSILDIVALPATALGELVSCAHCRSYEYFTEAVKNTKCRMWGHKASVARQRLSWARMIPAEVPDNRDKCEHARCAPVGLDTPDFPARGTFFVKTDSASPFCLMKDSADGQSLDELRELGYVD